MFPEKARDWVSRGLFPGLHYRIMEAGKLVEEQVLGHADLASGTRLTERSLFRLASASKLFVSAACLRLVDDGRLGLDEPVFETLPEFRDLNVLTGDGAGPARQAITITDLLRHTCGYGYGDTEPYGAGLRSAGLLKKDNLGMNCWRHDLPLRDWARSLAGVPLEDEPGTCARYGLGHDLLGAVLETRTGQDLATIVRENLTEPLSLSDTFFQVPVFRQADLTSFYHHVDNQLVLLERATDSAFLERPESCSGGGGWDMLGHGGLVSSAADVSRLLCMILGGGELDGARILSATSAGRLLESQTSSISQPEIQPGSEYAFGVAQVTDTSRAAAGPAGKLWWGGSTNTWFCYVPQTRRLGVFLTHTFPFGHKNAIFHFDRYAAQG